MKHEIYSLGLTHIGPFTDVENKKHISKREVFYCKVVEKFEFGYSYGYFIMKFQYIIMRISQIFFKFYEKYNIALFNIIYKFFRFILKHSFVIFRYILFSVLILLVIYDCVFNNWIIVKLYYYLPFYLIFVLWYKFSFFLYNTDSVRNEIIFERCYCYPEIAYMFVTDKDDEDLFVYMSNWCLDINKIYTQFEQVLISSHPLFKKRYIKVPAKIIDSSLPFSHIYLASDQSEWRPFEEGFTTIIK
jgi:hypothetical protein